MRSKVEVIPAAFIGGLEQALPHFTVKGGVCPQLDGVLGEGVRQEDRRCQ